MMELSTYLCIVHDKTPSTEVQSIGLCINYIDQKTGKGVLYIVTMVANSIIIHQLPECGNDIDALKTACPRRHVCWTYSNILAARSKCQYDYTSVTYDCVLGYIEMVLGPVIKEIKQSSIDRDNAYNIHDGIAAISYGSWIENSYPDFYEYMIKWDFGFRYK